jgi:hypothetical protein
LLHPTKLKFFVLISIFMHVGFAILFAKVSLSFVPPQVKKLSLVIMTRGEGRGDIVQDEAAWPMPKRMEPDFSAENELKSLEAEIKKWTRAGMPDLSFFSPKESIFPKMEITELAAEAHIKPPEELFSHLAAESKPRPLADFALRPAVPEISEND